MLPLIPECAWSRSIGLGWVNPYQVRYPSNLDDGPWHGMPLGGFGAGCIGRSHRGDFNLWHVDGGEHVFQTLPACQFAIFEQGGGDPAQTLALCTAAPTDGTLSAWNWYPASTDDRATGTYHALYPRSWFTYQHGFQAELTCEQFSPILAANYQETSYPIAVFEWTAHNPTDRPLTLSILLTWQNLVGWFTNTLKSPEVRVRDDGSPVYEYQPQMGQSTDSVNLLVGDEQRLGIVMGKADADPLEVAEGEGQWAIATLLNPTWEVFYHTRWNPAGDGSDLWQTFAQDGSLPDIDSELPAQVGEQLGAAIAIRFTLKPGQTRQIPFILTWDLPVTEFAEGVQYFRRYTDFFGRTGQNAWTIARTALKHYRSWQEKIQSWQAPVLQRDDLPDWFKQALFNELYDLTDGGALWSAADEEDPVGQFAVLECIDYRWYESLDVRLYGSFGLLLLWPELEKAVIRAFARAIPMADDRRRTIGYYYTIGADSPQALRKVAGATPHDLGAPNEHPWQQTNYTSYQDCNLWKDLPCDFVLQVYRDFLLTGSTDVDFLAECWPAIVETLTYLKTFDQDGDGIPENSGAPDQTFDDWKLRGISAYCGGLWLAALEAAIAIGERLSPDRVPDPTPICQFRDWLAQSRPLYQDTLWNGQYYRLDSASGSDVVMADQLCGQFYARLLGLPDIVPIDCARKALETVYDACFLKFQQGTLGAANGVRPDGSPENPQATHPLEVWTGINFGLAAFLGQMGLWDEGFRLAEAVVRQIYDHGLQFRTPEAITAAGTFRASHYLRAMAIWAVYHVLLSQESEPEQ
ncbi:bile acid beta-glucosidase [Leptolyngbya sp. 'hensonii']|uniref:GH116 family glycosyl hydrolase n=1 Tax=Leptolyngbya sp. 'hensonii' TaxID=1922337 RepID=UPI00094F73BA|nr:GH116 family glycosyl hydrolase [Leptolyngbya sp. 'hensonii']OLP19683.1 bile acid beta-glucosidase [Leptolyngbya sp. 'hensonii']